MKYPSKVEQDLYMTCLSTNIVLNRTFLSDETNDRWWGESAVPPAPAVAAVPPQRPSMSTSLNITSINRDEPSASPPRHHLAKDGIYQAYLTQVCKTLK